LQLLINSKNIDDRAFDRSYALINDWLKHGRYDEALQVVYSQEAAVFERFMKNHRLLTTFCEDFVSSNGLRDLFLGDLTTVGAWEAAFDLNISSAVRSRPSFLQAFNEILENTNLTEHIFKGKIEITGGTPGAYSFKVGGVHHVDALNGTIARIKSGTMTPPNSKGYYEARVEMHHPDNVNNSGWKVKPDRSTFFPDTWSKQKVQSEIAMVLETGNHTVMQSLPDGRQLLGGTMSDDVALRIWKAADGTVESAFPKL
jgi:hypothetical protein